jgi:hypothetical protein
VVGKVFRIPPVLAIILLQRVRKNFQSRFHECIASCGEHSKHVISKKLICSNKLHYTTELPVKMFSFCSILCLFTKNLSHSTTAPCGNQSGLYYMHYQILKSELAESLNKTLESCTCINHVSFWPFVIYKCVYRKTVTNR